MLGSRESTSVQEVTEAMLLLVALQPQMEVDMEIGMETTHALSVAKKDIGHQIAPTNNIWQVMYDVVKGLNKRSWSQHF